MEHSCIYDARNWSYRPQDWPHGFDFTTRAHSVGLKTSLYLGKSPRYCWHLGCILKSAMNIMLRTGGSYHDVNLSTIAGRDAELNACGIDTTTATWTCGARTPVRTAQLSRVGLVSTESAFALQTPRRRILCRTALPA